MLQARAGVGHDIERHFAASAAALVLPPSRLDVVRVGISMYGLWPSAETRLSARVARAMGREDPTTAALLGEVIAVPFSEEEAPVLGALRRDPAAMGDQMRAACGRWLARLVRGGRDGTVQLQNRAVVA